MSRASSQYISTRTYNSAFYSYDVNNGLRLNSNATVSNCPPGRILKETGRKLYPGIHPTVKTIMTGVYDAETHISGFIDSNAGIFALYNVNRAPELTDGADFNPRGQSNSEGVSHKGQSVYTLGDVVAGGQFYTINTEDISSPDEVVNVDFSQTSNYTMTITQDTELNALIVPPNKGTIVYLSVNGNGLAKLDFNLNFGGVIKRVIPILNIKVIVNLFSDGITMYPVSSSGGEPVNIPYQTITF